MGRKARNETCKGKEKEEKEREKGRSERGVRGKANGKEGTKRK